MGCRSYRDIILRDIDTDAEAFLIDIGEMLFCFLRIFMGHIQINVIFTSEFHLVIDRTCHDVTRGERQTFVVFLHKFFSVQRTQDTAIPSYRFGDQEARAVSRMEEGGRVELDELHVADSSFRAIHHCDTVTRSDQRVGRIAVDSFATSCCHNRHFGQERVYLAGVFV